MLINTFKNTTSVTTISNNNTSGVAWHTPVLKCVRWKGELENVKLLLGKVELWLLCTALLVNFNFILPKVNTDFIRQAQVLNIDNLRLILYL